MEYVGSTIKLAREMSGRTKYTIDATTGVVTAGVSQELLCRFLSDGQLHLLSSIIRQRPMAFWREYSGPVSINVEEYPISSPTERILNDSQFISVWYSYTGQKENYVRLNPRVPFERDTRPGDPTSYLVKDNKILLNPIPMSGTGTIRVPYYLQFDDLRIRSGQINGTPSGSSIVLNVGALDYAFTFDDADYVCVNDKYGTPLLYNAPISSYNSGTHTITVVGSVSDYLVSGGSLAGLAGGYVTIGKWTTTHSKMPDSCERYLRTYLQKRMLSKDSSTDVLTEDSELKTIETDIILGFAEQTSDVQGIPILDTSIIW